MTPALFWDIVLLCLLLYGLSILGGFLIAGCLIILSVLVKHISTQRSRGQDHVDT